MSSAVASSSVGSMERRRLQRHALIASDVVSDLVSVDIGSGETGGLLMNINEEGVGIQALARVRPRSTTVLRFKLPGQAEAMEVTGTIAWESKQHCVGVKFDSLADDARLHLRRWIAVREPATSQAAPGLLAVPEWPQASPATDIALLAEQMRTAVRADGAAIALREGSGIVCRASSGAAPDVGVHLNPHVGLSGECVRTAKLVCCADTARDERVNAAVCRELNLGSVVIAPVLGAGVVLGLVECMWSRPQAYNDADLREIEISAAVTAKLLSASAAEPSPLTVPSVAQPLWAANASVAQSPSAENEGSSLLDAPPAEAPLPSFVPRDEMPARRFSREAITGLIVSRWHTVADRSRILAEHIRADERVPTYAIIGAVLLLTLVGLYAWHSRASAPKPIPVSETTPTPLTAEAVNTSFSGSASSASPAAASLPAAKPEKGPSSSQPATRAEGKTKNATPLEIHRSTQTTEAAPPSLQTAIPLAGDNALSAMLAGVRPTSPALTAESSPVTPTQLVRRVEPQYPAMARNLGRQGTVVMKLVIDAEGRVADIKVVSGDPLLRPAAMQAVSGWRYRPAERDGQPVPDIVEVTVNFHLAR